ncbi:hypothetical protein [uncultured Salinicola sp.]|uniref:hypothetical protein n=1 Tax=uncultured Salinicola sp. TaxID=1193542 RepID=UPI00262043FA|nr:hypothetical protein [uncultured Salinicola sp.]|tara:strand:- start:180 stop:461 length:282 start_codon:yes stop_codon:yes gene_type:complete
MFDNLHIIDTLRDAGIEAGSITVNPEPSVRDVVITGATRDPVTGERRFDVAADAAQALANAGYDILCYGSGLGDAGTIATLMVQLPKPTRIAV